MNDWIEHRRGDRELLGWMRSQGEGFVVIDLLGREISAEKEDWGDINATAVYYDVEFPMPATLRVHEGDAFEINPFA